MNGTLTWDNAPKLVTLERAVVLTSSSSGEINRLVNQDETLVNKDGLIKSNKLRLLTITWENAGLIVNAEQAACLLNVSAHWVYRRLWDIDRNEGPVPKGRIPAKRPGRAWCIATEHVKAFSKETSLEELMAA